MSITIKYKIIKVFPDDHAMLVRYYTEEFPESALVSMYDTDGVTPLKYRTEFFITVPIPIPEGAEFDKFILSYAPIGFFKLQTNIIDPNIDTTMDSLAALLNEEKIVVLNPE